MRKISIKLILCLFISFALSSCAPAKITFENVHPDWNPPQGLDYAKAQCESKMNAFYPVNPFAIMPEKGRVYRSCMDSYGYKLQKSK